MVDRRTTTTRSRAPHSCSLFFLLLFLQQPHDLACRAMITILPARLKLLHFPRAQLAQVTHAIVKACFFQDIKEYESITYYTAFLFFALSNIPAVRTIFSLLQKMPTRYRLLQTRKSLTMISCLRWWRSIVVIWAHLLIFFEYFRSTMRVDRMPVGRVSAIYQNRWLGTSFQSFTCQLIKLILCW